MPPKAVIFDRDGTLNKTANNKGGYVLTPEAMKLLPHTQKALAKLADAGIDIYVFTQQGCIGKGLLDEQTLQVIHGRLNAQVCPARVKKFYYCPHTQGDRCSCRKPQPGLLFQCMDENGLTPDDVIVVGDAERDFKAAQAAGLDYYMVKHDEKTENAPESYLSLGRPVYSNVEEIVDSLLA